MADFATGAPFLNTLLQAEGIEVRGRVTESYAQILNPESLRFLAALHRTFDARRIELLKCRQIRQAEIDQGKLPDFLASTAHIRSGDWKCCAPAPGLVDRRVEITGPVDRKMIINALNSGATQFMADFEDATSPTWDNLIQGQLNMRDAIARTISFSGPEGKVYRLKDNGLATLLCRPRGLHLEEHHVFVDGQPLSGSLLDFGLYFYHNAKRSLFIGAGPYYYVPKLESHLEARWWNDVFNFAQDYVRVPRGTIRATVLIETILAAFEMEEILYELREHSSGLNCGRWDYIFSTIKRLRNHPQFVMPERKDVTMATTCHKRGVHAMGGMAAQIPIRNDPAANDAAFEKVRKDKLREAEAGHDGTWVAHPGLIPIAKEIFDKVMPTPNQIHVQKPAQITAADLLSTKFEGGITDVGVRANVSVALAYMANWLSGMGCVPLHNLMEDAATAEISRSQLWQWLKFASKTSEGQTITPDYVQKIIDEEDAKLKASLGDKYTAAYTNAKGHLRRIVLEKDFPEFLTLVCYGDIVEQQPPRTISHL
ncbi:malate synthase [Capsaspora owczarzaki ATCC 30864]|uniref:malate synthase n=1 Tax=Capsaspora owczarzaki (strain ATCC 30864) TaxID=595528 RepID=UPI0001FE3CBF|nr:malate synthase [Capsaspora owczarzaki ATCC 30864]|eukprot:XP_004343865.1 malate synthase [Capsaspora owczarzaki ATCC 30864]